MSDAEDRPVVIIGAGHAGVQLAVALRQGGWLGRILLMEAQAHLPYERPPLSKDHLSAPATDGPALLRKPSFYADKGIELQLDETVAAIDVAAKAVITDSGQSITYHRLVIATGADARRLSLPGADLPGVQCLRVLDEAQALRSRLRPGASIVVIGGGYIGLEVAAAAAKAGCRVTLLERDDRVMSRVTSPPVSRHFEALHLEHGVALRLGTSIARVTGQDRIEAIETDTGEVVAADTVVAGIGVIANDAMAAKAGIACRDGILVDGSGRTSAPDVYAIGDVARRVNGPEDMVGLRLECIQNAVDQANAVATHIVNGGETAVQVPWFWTVQYGVRLQSAGLAAPGDQILRRPAANGNGFSLLYLRDGRLAAIDTINNLPDFVPARKLIAAGARVDALAATDPAVKLGQIATKETIE